MFENNICCSCCGYDFKKIKLLRKHFVLLWYKVNCNEIDKSMKNKNFQGYFETDTIILKYNKYNKIKKYIHIYTILRFMKFFIS